MGDLKNNCNKTNTLPKNDGYKPVFADNAKRMFEGINGVGSRNVPLGTLNATTFTNPSHQYSKTIVPITTDSSN